MHELPEDVFADAVYHFWETRTGQARQQATRGVADQGARSAVTGGKQMDGFAERIDQRLKLYGVPGNDIYRTKKRQRLLPGFFRPTKEWDLLVMARGQLVAAIELKSQVGPSFGNNFNNRTEEALGNAVDVWTAYREGGFNLSPEPWLGYVMLLEECDRSTAPVAVREPHFAVRQEFHGASYARRYELLCRKLVRERQYSAACFLTSNRDWTLAASPYREPAEDLSARHFLGDLLRHASSFFA